MTAFPLVSMSFAPPFSPCGYDGVPQRFSISLARLPNGPDGFETVDCFDHAAAASISPMRYLMKATPGFFDPKAESLAYRCINVTAKMQARPKSGL
jgi:hypothetical protein